MEQKKTTEAQDRPDQNKQYRDDQQQNKQQDQDREFGGGRSDRDSAQDAGAGQNRPQQDRDNQQSGQRDRNQGGQGNQGQGHQGGSERNR